MQLGGVRTYQGHCTHHEARKCYDEWRKTREGIRDNVRFWEECIAQEIRQLSEGAVE